jgi:hypothetical protein
LPLIPLPLGAEITAEPMLDEANRILDIARAIAKVRILRIGLYPQSSISVLLSTIEEFPETDNIETCPLQESNLRHQV